MLIGLVAPLRLFVLRWWSFVSSSAGGGQEDAPRSIDKEAHSVASRGSYHNQRSGESGMESLRIGMG